MSFIQRLFSFWMPRRWFAQAEEESRHWLVQCETCGLAHSVWELGGIRWRATGNPRVHRFCSHCGQKTWHTISYHAPT